MSGEFLEAIRMALIGAPSKFERIRNCIKAVEVSCSHAEQILFKPYTSRITAQRSRYLMLAETSAQIAIVNQLGSTAVKYAHIDDFLVAARALCNQPPQVLHDFIKAITKYPLSKTDTDTIRRTRANAVKIYRAATGKTPVRNTHNKVLQLLSEYEKENPPPAAITMQAATGLVFAESSSEPSKPKVRHQMLWSSRLRDDVK